MKKCAQNQDDSYVGVQFSSGNKKAGNDEKFCFQSVHTVYTTTSLSSYRRDRLTFHDPLPRTLCDARRISMRQGRWQRLFIERREIVWYFQAIIIFIATNLRTNKDFDNKGSVKPQEPHLLTPLVCVYKVARRRIIMRDRVK